MRVRGTKFQKLVSTTWTDVATVTAKKPFIISYQCSDLTTAAVATGTATNASTSQTLEVA